MQRIQTADSAIANVSVRCMDLLIPGFGVDLVAGNVPEFQYSHSLLPVLLTATVLMPEYRFSLSRKWTGWLGQRKSIFWQILHCQLPKLSSQNLKQIWQLYFSGRVKAISSSLDGNAIKKMLLRYIFQNCPVKQFKNKNSYQFQHNFRAYECKLVVLTSSAFHKLLLFLITLMMPDVYKPYKWII